MTLFNRLQKTQPENLRKISDTQLESDTAILTFGGRQVNGRNRFCIDVMDKNAGECYRFTPVADRMWDMYKNGQKVTSDLASRGRLSISITNNMKGTLGEFAPSCCGELMQRAVCGLAYSVGRAIYRDRSELDVALSRAGLAVGKNGKVMEEDEVFAQLQNQGGRS